MGRRERRREKRKKFWMNIFLAAMFVFIVVGMTLGGLGTFGGNDRMKYGDFKFQIIDNRYVTEINEQPMPFYFLPSQVDYINVSSIVTNKLREAYLVMMTFNPKDKDSIQVMEVVRFDFSRYLGKVVYNGILEGSPEYDLPLLTCANATLQTPVIILNTTALSSTASVVESGNCIYLNARGTEFLRLRDRILYSYHGVIEDE